MTTIVTRTNTRLYSYTIRYGLVLSYTRGGYLSARDAYRAGTSYARLIMHRGQS